MIKLDYNDTECHSDDTAMEDLRLELDKLNERQRAYVVARSKSNSDAQALIESGIPKKTFYRMDKATRDHLNELAQHFKSDTAYKVMLKLKENAEKAADTLAELMQKSRNDNVKIKAAQDILDRTVGKASESIDITSGNEPITFIIKRDTGEQDAKRN